MRCTVLGLCEKERCYSESYLIGSVRTGTGIQGFLGAVCIEGLGFDLDIGFNRVWFLVVFSTAGNLDPRCRGYDPWGSRTLRGVSTGGVESFVVFP